MSKRILAARLKTALNQTAVTQVAAHGFGVMNSTTTFSGKGAYCVYSGWTKNMWDHNAGKYYTQHMRKFRINYPALNDAAMLTRGEADILTGYMLHETAHVLYTNNDVKGLQASFGRTAVRLESVHTVANGFEDPRIEEAVNRAGVAKNSRVLFDKLFSKVTDSCRTKGYNPCDWANVPVTLAVLGRQALGNGNAWSAQLLNRIPEPYRAIYAQAMAWYADAPFGFDDNGWSYSCALKFRALWKQMREDEGKSNDTDQPEDGDQTEDAQDAQDAQDGEGEQDGDDAGPQGDPDPDRDDDRDGEGDGGEDDEWSDDAFDDEGTDDYDDEGESGEIGKDDQSDQHADDEGDGGEDGEGEDGEQEGEDSGSEYSPTGDSGEAKPAEPNIDDIIKRANKRTGASDDEGLGVFCPAKRGEDIFDTILRGYK